MTINTPHFPFFGSLKYGFEYVRKVIESLSCSGRCYSCEVEWHRDRESICNYCWNELQKAPPNLANKYINMEVPISIIYRYTSLMRNIIHQMKFLGRRDIAVSLGYYAGGLYRKNIIDKKFDVIVPIPYTPNPCAGTRI